MSILQVGQELPPFLLLLIFCELRVFVKLPNYLLAESIVRWLWDPLLSPEFETWVLDGYAGLACLPSGPF